MAKQYEPHRINIIDTRGTLTSLSVRNVHACSRWRGNGLPVQLVVFSRSLKPYGVIRQTNTKFRALRSLTKYRMGRELPEKWLVRF